MRELSDLDLGSREGRQVSTEKRKRDSAANPGRSISIVSVDYKKKKRVEIDNSESFDFAGIVLDLEIQDRFTIFVLKDEKKSLKKIINPNL